MKVRRLTLVWTLVFDQGFTAPTCTGGGQTCELSGYLAGTLSARMDAEIHAQNRIIGHRPPALGRFENRAGCHDRRRRCCHIKKAKEGTVDTEQLPR